MSNVYLARQSIVNIDEKLEAYEIMYRDVNQEITSDNDRFHSISVINSVLNKFGTKEFLSEHKAFIEVDERFLMSDLIKTIPTDFFTLAISNDFEITEKTLERIEQLHEQGFSLGVHDIDLNIKHFNKYKNILDKLSYFKIKMRSDMSLEDKGLIVKLQELGIKVVATKIEDSSSYEKAKDLKFDLYQGYCFAKPQILKNEKFDPSKFNILNLYNMLISDTNIDEITAEFEKNHALTLQLLQFVNSANFHFKNRISSIHHILTLVGRKPLSEWLMLMIYSKSVSTNDKVPPLMLMVRNRTELMQNLLKVLKPDVKSNALGEAYLVGILSLIDTVFQADLEEILESINISDITKQALLKDEGTLGAIYKVVRDIEDFNLQEIVAFSKKYKLVEESIQEVILQAIEDVNEFERSFKDN